jgi:hypothetical protein
LLKPAVVNRPKEDDMNEMHATQTAAAPPPRTWKAVYTIVERAEKRFWIRVGTAFVNRDLSLNVRLDASPVNGELHIRDAEPFNPAARRSNGPGGGGGEPFAHAETLS